MGREQLSQRPNRLTYQQRERIFDTVYRAVTKHYFDPKFNGSDGPTVAQSSKGGIVGTEDPERFELAMHDLVRRLGTSHTGFFHQSVRRVPARLAIGTTFSRVGTTAEAYWVAEDVHAGGPGAAAGMQAGDMLKTINGQPIAPPEQPTFAMGEDWSVGIRRAEEDLILRVIVPAPRSRKRPYCEPQAVSASRLDGITGYLKVAIFPGLLGLGVAREIDAAVRELSSCDRLIIDLRGHLGGA